MTNLMWCLALFGILIVCTSESIFASHHHHHHHHHHQDDGENDNIIPYKDKSDDKKKNKTNFPEQIHLSLGTNETEMFVTWVTLHSITDKPLVQYGKEKHNLTETTNSVEVTLFKQDGAHFYTYRSLITGLKPATKYYYRVGSEKSAFSTTYHFHTLPSGDEWLPQFAIYGDLGYQDEKSLPYLTKDVEKDDPHYDVIFHIGDFAYDLNERDGEQGNDFMRSIEQVSAVVPYMTCPGNHERKSNFSHYDARFSMLGDRHEPAEEQLRKKSLTHRLNNHFYSVDIGPAHILIFSTEYYYYTQFGWEQIERQYRFLEQDLARANSNRAQRPWIIVMGHRPLYCLKIGDESCDIKTMERKYIREGIHMHHKSDQPRQYGLENLFYKYGVDLFFAGHEHFYGRLMPVYNYTIDGGSSRSNPYDDPQAPVHIITGSAGNREHHPAFNSKVNTTDWIANHKFDYGYTRITFKSRNQIVLEQTSDDQGGKVIDTVEIIKNHHQPSWLRN